MTTVHARDGRPSTLPPIRELAARVRAGEDLHDIAAQYGFAYSSLTSRFSQAGFVSTGESFQEQKRRLLREALARPGKPAWMADSACTDYHPDLWYSDNHNGMARAKEICGECPALRACLKWAIETDERWGIFGGRTYKERQNLKRRVQYEAKQTGTAA